MIWKNPFLLKNSEQHRSDDAFLDQFDATALQLIISDNLEKVSYVSSTPGAGKTSIFRAFSASALTRIVQNESKETYKEIRQAMTYLGVLSDGKVSLASTVLSCARGYSIIDEMFQNGRRKHIFIALLNYRIAISLLRNLGIILELESEQYDRISFSSIPEEMMSEEKHFWNGKSLYIWACEGERNLCRYLDSERNENLEISFVHTTLIILKLFEPENILIDGKPYFRNTLIILDDYHKLSELQKIVISEAVYTLKTRVGVWFGQRLEGVSDSQLISMDGSLSREYNKNIVIDNFWPDKKDVFYKMLGQIADKRIHDADITDNRGFGECIVNELSISKHKKTLVQFNEKEKSVITGNPEAKSRYDEVLKYIECNDEMGPFDRAVWLKCITIQENRRQTGQMMFYFGEKTKVSDFRSFVDKTRGIAEYYICNSTKIPYYFGINNLKIISSYNVEQFLFFASVYFERYRIKNLDGGKRKKLGAEEQEKALTLAVKQKWDDMDYRYVYIEEIKIFLNSMAEICIQSRKAERAAYAGGAYTGIAIDRSNLLNCMKNDKYSKLTRILGACLSSKYLERREIDHGNTIVFYFNRWLCVYYRLPLAYGGWKKCNADSLLHMAEGRGTISFDDNQVRLDI